jgi:hypothetical protein
MDKRLEKNKQNVINLKQFLIEIIESPKEILAEMPYILTTLKNQGSLSKYQDKKREIFSSSLNTIKRTADRFIEKGFEEIERLRVLAIHSINKELNKTTISQKVNKEELKSVIKENKIEQEELKAVHLVLLNQLMEDLNTFNKICSINDIYLIKEISKTAKQRIQSLGTKTAEFISLVEKKEQINLIIVK